MTELLRVGVVGAGSWAQRIHVPGLHAHGRIQLTAVWSRRPAAARALAEPYGAQVATDFDELLDSSDAVVFAVPPAVQAELAPQAAFAGKHLILEKPLASDVTGARRIVKAAEAANTAALMMLTRRYAPEVREWLAKLHSSTGWQGGSGRWLASGLLPGEHPGSQWRHEEGAMLDAGPHAIDLLDAALGEIVNVRYAHRNSHDLWQVVFDHISGASSMLTLSLRMPIQPAVVDFAVYGENGYVQLPNGRTFAHHCYARMLDEFLFMIRTGRHWHPCDVRRGLHLQEVLAEVHSAAFVH
ncbi:Gfo/Idh/MocA family protein [Saccharopolyspora rectivirgula]|jgi:predicted dehydrogenase|uniref:Dehydrogenase n=1 Tax=Saccharopolyspora rectivirgula TaxID=28042 RepID=A0A073AWB3_9PSEU|nr:Gfo/Idh/MocA family oxidoreductase [Saccharopolyspora rectivirgula]KEI43680.1 dehydrogenase [Saccharopolyspora rectivirgula]